MNIDALFADETENFRFPAEPGEAEEVCFLFRTAADDGSQVYFVEEEEKRKTIMKKVCSDGVFDYYEHRQIPGLQPLYYVFYIENGEEHVFYNRLGVSETSFPQYRFRLIPGFSVPEWAKGAVMYQIYVDRFYNGNPDNDVKDREYIYLGKPVTQVTDWEKFPEQMDVGFFYGGDLQGVLKKLDYLQTLGVEVLYLNPIFVSPSNHKYDCQDYDHIDPHYGVLVKDGGEVVEEGAFDNKGATRYMIRTTDQDNLAASDAFFSRFIQEIHRRGMKVILDGVFNHCGSFHKWLDGEGIYAMSGDYEPGAFLTKESPYQSYFRFSDQEGWPYNDTYDGWWGHLTLPKLNYEESPALFEEILAVARKWISPPYCADGWRLDVAADLGRTSQYNHEFWRAFRKAVKEANPEALILAEHYGDPSDWLQGDQWDTIMNYDGFMEPVSWFLTGMEKHSDEKNMDLFGDGKRFFQSMNEHMSRMMTGSLFAAMNQLSNHDHSRFLTRTNQKTGRAATLGPEAASLGVHYGIFREAVMIQMTWPGAPAIYYGDEAGLCGFTDPDNRRTYPWGREDFELIEFHRYMTSFHRRMKALRKGSLKQLLAEDHLISYGRFCEGSVCAVAVNHCLIKREVEIPVWQLGVRNGEKMIRHMFTDERGYNVGKVTYTVQNGHVNVWMPETSSVLLVLKTT